MKILVTGATGKLGGALAQALQHRDAEVELWQGRRGVDLSDLEGLRGQLRRLRPELVFHTAAISAISECFSSPELAFRVNAEATRVLAEEVPRLLYTSTDLVFGGDKAPYAESASPAPLSRYGASKARGEEAVLEHGHTVVRLSLMFGPTPGGGFFDGGLQQLLEGRSANFFTDEFRTPLSLGLAALGLLDIADGGQSGLFHLCGHERVSRHQLALRVAEHRSLDPALARAGSQAEVSFPEPRPKDVSLTSRLFCPTLEQSLLEALGPEAD